MAKIERGEPSPEFEDFMDATVAWYTGPGFEDAFNRFAGVTMMDFGTAMQAVKVGHRVHREKWTAEEPGRHIRRENVDKVVDVGFTIAAPHPDAYANGDGVITHSYSPDSGDILAEDWRYWNAHLGTTEGATAGDPLAQRCEAAAPPGGFATTTHDAHGAATTERQVSPTAGVHDIYHDDPDPEA